MTRKYRPKSWWKKQRPHPRTTPEHLVLLIKSIINQDRRERYAAGFKLGTRGLARRIAQELGMNLHTVLAIKERKRHAKDGTHGRLLQQPTTVELERLEKIRQRRIRKGLVGASYRGFPSPLLKGGLSYRKRILGHG